MRLARPGQDLNKPVQLQLGQEGIVPIHPVLAGGVDEVAAACSREGGNLVQQIIEQVLKRGAVVLVAVIAHDFELSRRI